MVSAFLTDTGVGEMPDARMLAGVREFQPSLQPEGGAQCSITQLMSLLRDKSGPAPSLATIATGEGLPVLPKKRVKKIQEGKYVDSLSSHRPKGKLREHPAL